VKSKTCNECGWINQELKLSDREWTCKNGHKLDRDLNASQNILKEGLKIYREELAITKVERKSDFGNKAHSMKPEAQPIAFGVGG
jgi:putative transposase